MVEFADTFYGSKITFTVISYKHKQKGGDEEKNKKITFFKNKSGGDGPCRNSTSKKGIFGVSFSWRIQRWH